MKKAVYLILSLGAILFLGVVFYGNGIVQASSLEDAGDEVEIEAYEFEADIETTEDDRPRNNGRLMLEDCPYREEGRYLDEDCPYRNQLRRRRSDDMQESQDFGGRMLSSNERPCSRRR